MQKKINGFFGILLNDKSLLINEPLEEILRERFYHYKRNGKFFDCWIIQNPKFLENMKLSSKSTENFVILSCNKSLILILKSRLANSVKYFEFIAPNNEIVSPLS